MRAPTIPIVLATTAAVAVVGAAVTFAIGITRDEDRPAASFDASLMMGGGGMMGAAMGAVPSLEPDPVSSLEGAKQRVEEWLPVAGFDGFGVGEVMAFSNGYYVAVHDGAGRGAFELLVDPASGWIAPEPGPNMMWNTEYGMMGGRLGGLMMSNGFGGMMGSGMMSGTATTPTVPLSSEDAKATANQWLERALPGETVGEPHAFPGYFTFDTERGGQVQGMLSVNARTGIVWYHVWHGRFLDELEV